jgi:hypothetical protein
MGTDRYASQPGFSVLGRENNQIHFVAKLTPLGRQGALMPS